MPNGKKQPDEIRIDWEYDKDYRMVPANGMWGGITPRGDLRIEFFVEAVTVPNSGDTTLVNDGSGRYKEKRKTPEKPAVVRRIQVGVMVPPQQILSFMEWFRNKAKGIKVVSENPTEKVN